MLGLTFFLLGITFSNAYDTIEIDLDKLLQPGVTHLHNPNQQQYNPQQRPFNRQPVQQYHLQQFNPQSQRPYPRPQRPNPQPQQPNPQALRPNPQPTQPNPQAQQPNPQPQQPNPQAHNIQPSYPDYPEPFDNNNIRKRSCNAFMRYRQPDYDDRPIWGSGGETTTRRVPIQQRNTPPPRNSAGTSRQKCMEYCRPTNPTVQFSKRAIQTSTSATGSPPIIFFGVQGGTDSKLNEFSHMVAIGFRNGGSGSTSWNSCGGTLISHWYVMTAAHCTDSDLGAPTLVRLGALNINRNLPGQEVEDIGVAQVIVHPQYKGTRGDQSVYNDIALLKLERRVEFREGVQPACLYDERELTQNEVVATGWGNLGFADAPSDVLQKVQLDIIPGQQCKDLLGTDATIPRGIQSQSQVCAGVLEGGRDTCSGDSGGPLQVNNTRTFRPGYSCGMEVIGITSFGKFCAEKNSPGVYTRVANYIPWIENIVWKNED